MFLRLIKFILIILLFTFCISADIKCVFGQSDVDHPQIMQSNNNGEETQTLINVLISEALSGKERVFVIARLGTAEKSRRLNLARLNKAKRHIVERYRNDLQKMFAEGESIKGEGRVEFYVGSRLWLVVLAKRNELPLFTCEGCP